MRGPDEAFRYKWELRWTGSCYRGRYRELTWRDVWWVPLMITVAPLTPALLALLIAWLTRL